MTLFAPSCLLKKDNFYTLTKTLIENKMTCIFTKTFAKKRQAYFENLCKPTL